MVNNILIEVLGSIAEDERRRIHQRQREGIDCALDKGIVFGRPQIQFPENWQCVMEQVKNKEITSVTAMELLNLKKTTYYKLCMMMERETGKPLDLYGGKDERIWKRTTDGDI